MVFGVLHDCVTGRRTTVGITVHERPSRGADQRAARAVDVNAERTKGRSLTSITIRAVGRDDIESIKQLAVENRMFGPDEVEFFDETINGHLDGTRPDDRWFLAEVEGRLIGATYVAPEPFGHLVWNLYFIATEPSGHGRGVGSQMITAVEEHLGRLGATRALVSIVETSATDQYAGARRFYASRGFDHESTIRDYYGPGDAKVTYWKAMNR